MSSDLPVGQQPKSFGPFFNESAEEINVSIRKLVAGLDAFGIRPYADNAPSWSWVLFCLDAIDKLQREVARARAQVAEELAGLVGSLCPARVDHAGVHCDYAVAAAAIREHAGKGLPGHAAALPDVVGTPYPREVRDAQFDCIQAWAEARDVRGYLTFGDIEQLVTNLEALQYEVSTAAGGGEADQSNASDLGTPEHPEARDA